MRLLLNIGLQVGAAQTLAAHVVREILIANDFILHGEGKVFESDTEPTPVIGVDAPPRIAGSAARNPRQTAVDLGQDCVAVVNPLNGFGTLVGPKAAEWGAFNPALFILPNGKRLAS